MGTTKEERSLRVANMRANFAQEGGAPDAQHEALLERYIEGTATLADLYDHAREYLYTFQERERLRLNKVATDVEFQRLSEYHLRPRDIAGNRSGLQQHNVSGVGGSRRRRRLAE